MILRFVVAALSLLLALVPVAEARTMYKARAFCSVKDVYGFSEFRFTRKEAIAQAVDRCTARGGIPRCCASTALIIDQYQDDAAPTFAARSHCAITGATGVGSGRSLRAAQASAVRACIGKGGVPRCCRNDVKMLD